VAYTLFKHNNQLTATRHNKQDMKVREIFEEKIKIEKIEKGIGGLVEITANTPYQSINISCSKSYLNLLTKEFLGKKVNDLKIYKG